MKRRRRGRSTPSACCAEGEPGLLRLADYGYTRRAFVGQDGILRAGWQPALGGHWQRSAGGLPTCPPGGRQSRQPGRPLPSPYFASLNKYVVLEVRLRIVRSLADARGSDRSRDREGAVFAEYGKVLMKPCTRREARREYEKLRAPN